VSPDSPAALQDSCSSGGVEGSTRGHGLTAGYAGWAEADCMRMWVCELMGLGTAVGHVVCTVCTVWDDDDDDDARPICHMLCSFGVWSVLLIHAVSSC
jgi:hypothetical protein